MRLQVVHPDGRTTALEPAPATNAGFSERAEYRIQAPCRGMYRFFVDDEPLEEVASSSQWRWSPGFYAGEVTAELRDASDQTLALYLLDVAPNEGKLGRDIYHGMLDEIWESEPSMLVGSEPATTSRGELGATQDPLIAYARLRRHLPVFLSTMWKIQRAPLTTLLCTRIDLAPHRIRRADRQTAIAASHSPAAVAMLRDPLSFDGVCVRLDVPHTKPVLDSPANRALLAATLSLLRRAASVSERLAHLSRSGEASETETALAPRWPARRRLLDQAQADLRQLLRVPPLSEVVRAEFTAAGLNAISASPSYARAYGAAWGALRTGFSGPRATERLWMSPTWRVYESWVFVRLAAQLRSMFPGGWKRRASGANVAWACETSGLAIHAQPTFSRHEYGDQRFRALSRRRIPDIVITRRFPKPEFVVLDAKYMCTSASVVDAMDSAHVYHDALRWENRRPALSLLLVPSGGSTPWLEDPAFILRERVGVRELGPGTDVSALLRETIGDARLPRQALGSTNIA